MAKRVICYGCYRGRGKLKQGMGNPQLHLIPSGKWVCSDCLEVIGLMSLDALEGIEYESSWIDRLHTLMTMAQQARNVKLTGYNYPPASKTE